MHGPMKARMKSSIRKACGSRHALVDRSAGFVSQFVKKKFEDGKGVVTNRKSKNRQHNGQKIKIQKSKQRFTKHSTKNKRSSNTNPTGCDLRCSGRVSSSCSTCDNRLVKNI